MQGRRTEGSGSMLSFKQCGLRARWECRQAFNRMEQGNGKAIVGAQGASKHVNRGPAAGLAR